MQLLQLIFNHKMTKLPVSGGGRRAVETRLLHQLTQILDLRGQRRGAGRHGNENVGARVELEARLRAAVGDADHDGVNAGKVSGAVTVSECEPTRGGVTLDQGALVRRHLGRLHATIHLVMSKENIRYN